MIRLIIGRFRCRSGLGGEITAFPLGERKKLNALKYAVAGLGQKVLLPRGDKNPIHYWREQILRVGYLISATLGLINVAGFSLAQQILARQFWTAVAGVTGCIWAVVVLLAWKRWPSAVRSLSAMVLIYINAVVGLWEVGLHSVASAEFVCICTFAAVFYEMRGALAALGLVTVTLAVFALLLSPGNGFPNIDVALNRFLAWSLWTLLWSAATAMAAAILFKGLAQAVLDEQNLRNSLERIVQQRTRVLDETNARLNRENARRKTVELEKEQKIIELQKALSEIRTLQGLLPICSACKRVRNDAGYWQGIESYLHTHTMAELTHGICPDCMHKLYPEWDFE